MIEIIAAWIIIGALGVSLAAPLGPINVEIIKHTLNKSSDHKVAWISGILTGIGAMTGDFVVAFAALTLGGEILINVFSDPIVLFLLFTANIIILGYLGFSTLLKKPEFIDTPDRGSVILNLNSSEGLVRQLVNRYITGFSIVITSPWSYLWWISAGTIILFSDLNAPDLFSRLVIVLMFLSGILVWNLFFSTSLTLAGRIPNPALLQWITKGSAFILLIFAGFIAFEWAEILLELFST